MSEVSDPRRVPYTDRGTGRACASRAGDVSGLKYSPGMVYSGKRKCVSSGVTAGETKGVKFIYAVEG